MQALIFLSKNICYFFAILFLLRFFMQAFRISFAHTLGQFILKLTEFLVKPLRKIIAPFYGLDWANLIAAWLCIVFFYLLQLFLQNTVILNWQAFLGIFALWITIAFLRLIIQLFIFAILLFALLSWIAPHHPMMPIFYQFTRPILRPFTRLIPLIAGIDLSPVVAILILEAVLLLLPMS